MKQEYPTREELIAICERAIVPQENGIIETVRVLKKMLAGYGSCSNVDVSLNF
jgi:hypothetical protein